MKYQNKKTTRNIIVGVILIALLLLVLNYFGVFSKIKLQAVGDVPTTGCGLVEQGQRGLEFQCTDKTCYVNGFYNCSSKTGEIPTVIFRTNVQYSKYDQNGIDGKVAWIAIDIGRGVLDSFSYNQKIEFNNILVNEYIIAPDGSPVFYQDRGIYVDREERGSRSVCGCTRKENRLCYPPYCYGSNCDISCTSYTTFIYYKYIPSVDANTNSSPVVPYSIYNLEKSSPVSKFSCSKTYQWIRNSQVIESNTITYSGQSEGDMETGIKQLQKDDIFKFDLINYVIYGDTGTVCSKNVCSSDGTGIQRCIKQAGGCNYLSKTIELCGVGVCAENQEGTDVECTTNPYYLILSKTKTGTTYKDSFTKGESIIYEYKISSKLTKADSLSFTLTTPTQTISLSGVTSPTMPFLSSVNIPNSNTQESGSYEITVIAKYGTETYIVGKKIFNVAIPIYLSTRFYSIKGGSGVLYTNEPSYVQIDAWDSPPETETKNRVEIKNPNSLARLNNGSINYISKDCSFSSCTFKYELNYPGIFSYEASAESLIGYKATVQDQTDIKQPFVKPEFINVDKLECVQPNIPISIQFQTKSPQGELIQSSNLIKIYKPAGTPDSINLDCTGDCSFDYVFSVEGGHKFGIISSSSGYSSYPEVQSPYIYVKADCTPPECTKTEDCISPKQCVNYKCIDVCDSWTCQPYFYFIVIFGGIGILVLIIILVLVLRKKKPEGSLINL